MSTHATNKTNSIQHNVYQSILFYEAKLTSFCSYFPIPPYFVYMQGFKVVTHVIVARDRKRHCSDPCGHCHASLLSPDPSLTSSQHCSFIQSLPQKLGMETRTSKHRACAQFCFVVLYNKVRCKTYAQCITGAPMFARYFTNASIWHYFTACEEVSQIS